MTEPTKRTITLREVAQLVRDMRDAQKTFFRNSSTMALSNAKALERRVDELVSEVLDDQLKLF